MRHGPSMICRTRGLYYTHGTLLVKWNSKESGIVRRQASYEKWYYKQHCDILQYRNRDPENLLENNTMLQLMWLGSAIHIDVQQHHLPTGSKLIPSTLAIGLTQLFYRGRNRRGPQIRKTDKGMGLAIFSKKCIFTERAKSLLDPTKYLVHTTPTTYHKCNGSRIYMMPKIHKGKIPVPGRILVKGFSYLEALNLLSISATPSLRNCQHLSHSMNVVPSTNTWV